MTTKIASTVASGTAPIAAIDSHDDDQSEQGGPTAVVAVNRGSHRRSTGMLVAATLTVAVAVLVLVSSISTRHRADERRRLELADVVGRYEVAMTGHEWVALEPLLGPAFVFHNVEYGAIQDRAGFLAWAAIIGDSYAGFAISLDGAQFEEDVATVRFHQRGNDADTTETPGAAGVTGVVRMRIVARQIVEMWSNYDEFGLLQNRSPSAAG
jgi:hypothetical protein